jgi:glycosyltransferase involved in cell wall biosynthesis
MTLKDKLTIVIPCKNEEKYISHLLDSLKQQIGIEGVRIIIADKSDDNTPEVIIKTKQDLNVEIIEGGPVSRAKNNGAALVTTEYLLFIDSDVRFFSNMVIADTVRLLEQRNLDLIGLNIRCYDKNILTQIGFSVFNVINRVLSKFCPFAVGAYMLTRTEKFRELGGFPEKHVTSEDFHLSRMYSVDKFMIAKHYFGQDSRRFKKMGYFGMAWYLIKNFIHRNNKAYWDNIDGNKYWL